MSPVFYKEGRVSAPRRRFDATMAAGAVIVVLGVLLTLDTLEIFNISEARRFWPLILVALGVGRIAEGPGRRRSFGFLMLGLGVAFQLQQFGLLAVEWSDLGRWWPLMLVGALYALFDFRWRGRGLLFVCILVVGGYLQLRELGLVDFPIQRLWPLGLVMLGLYIILRRRKGRAR